MKLVLLSVLAAGVAVLGAAPASASTDSWPVCSPVPVLDGGVCADPGHPRCLVYGGGTIWNMCVVNPVPLLCQLTCTAPE